MTKIETDILLELVDARRETLRQLRDLGIQQQASVKSGDTELLFRVLAAKQRVLGDLQQTERRLAPYQDQDPDTRHWRTAEDRQRCAERARECSQLLADVIRQERESEKALILRRDEAADQLNAVHSAMHLRETYESQNRGAPSRLDLTCSE